MTRSVRRELRLPLPVRPQRPRVGRRRTARGPRLGRAPSCRSRSTRCTSKRASLRSGSATPPSGAPACSRCCGASRCATRSPTSSSTAHVAAFAARHDHGAKIAKSDVLARDRDLGRARRRRRRGRGRDAAGRSKTLAAEHTEAVKRYAMFGVPTFIVGERAAFVRFMDRDRPTTSTACSTCSSRPTSTSSSTRASPGRPVEAR